LSEILKKPVHVSGYIFSAKTTSGAPFSAWSKSKKALDKLTNIPPWTLHDLRRSFRTNLGRVKVRPDIAERLVNHISARTEMEETYDLHLYLDEMRDAMELWENFLTNLFTGALCGVVQSAA
jgi:integrase